MPCDSVHNSRNNQLYTFLAHVFAVFKYWGPSRRVSGFHVDLDFRLDFSMDFCWKSTIFLFWRYCLWTMKHIILSPNRCPQNTMLRMPQHALRAYIYIHDVQLRHLKNDLCIVNGKSVVYKGYSLCVHGDWISRFQIGFPDFNWIFADSVRDFWTPSCDACVI